jgi:hypothetical protein
MMENAGTVDRLLRTAVGALLLAYALFGSVSYNWLGAIGVVPILTAALGWCPAYDLFGISTQQKAAQP